VEQVYFGRSRAMDALVELGRGVLHLGESGTAATADADHDLEKDADAFHGGAWKLVLIDSAVNI
jgi:hypothetical protein